MVKSSRVATEGASTQIDETVKRLDAEIAALTSRLEQFGTPPKAYRVPRGWSAPDKRGRRLPIYTWVTPAWEGTTIVKQIHEARQRRDQVLAEAKVERQKVAGIDGDAAQAEMIVAAKQADYRAGHLQFAASLVHRDGARQGSGRRLRRRSALVPAVLHRLAVDPGRQRDHDARHGALTPDTRNRSACRSPHPRPSKPSPLTPSPVTSPQSPAAPRPKSLHRRSPRVNAHLPPPATRFTGADDAALAESLIAESKSARLRNFAYGAAASLPWRSVSAPPRSLGP